MSFRLSFHQPILGTSGAYWLDDPPDLSCKENTRQHAVDDPLLSCKQLRPQLAQHRLLAGDCSSPARRGDLAGRGRRAGGT
jgi:hypothetical protein